MNRIVQIIFIGVITISCNNKNSKSAANLDFEAYLSNFPEKKLPYSLSFIDNAMVGNDITNHLADKKNELSDDYVRRFICQNNPKCNIDRDGAFYRFFYWAKFSTNATFKIVLFYQHTDPSLIYLMTYSTQGRIIDKIVFAGNDGDIFDIDGAIDTDLAIKVTKVQYLPIKKDGQNYLDWEINDYIYTVGNNGKFNLLKTIKRGVKRFSFEE